MPTADDPPHDFSDQAIREQLQSPANLRELLHEVLGEIADGFVCEEREILPRDFPLEDWRHRESDLLFRIPYKTPAETVPVFVCVLLGAGVEGLGSAAQAAAAVALDTGGAHRLSYRKRAWRKHRKLAGLLGGPKAFHKYAPSWRPLFLDLAGKTPAELLEAAGEWLSALALVRADDEEAEAFRAVLEHVLRRLEGLADRDQVRW